MAEPGEIPFRDLDDLNGATLADRFRLDEMVGRGGYGAVFVGEQTSIGRRCAVKVLVPHVLEQQRNVKRFEREARATSMLVHPNTVVIYDFGLDEARRLLYIAMEFIEGESLKERITRHRTLDLETAAWICYQAAGSLQDAHERGLVHRDIKPHNIMLTDRGGDADFVKVIDFGIAKFLDDDAIRETFRRVTQTGVVIGTPAYMSPEQVRSEELDGRADQYALAACVYQMLTGMRLFNGKSPVDIATKQLTHRPRPASELNDEIPAAVDRVLLRALAKNRDDRFETIVEFAAELADAADVQLPTSSAERRRAALMRDELAATEPMSVSDIDEAATKSARLNPPTAQSPKPQPRPKPDSPRLIEALTSVTGVVGPDGRWNTVGVVVMSVLALTCVTLVVLIVQQPGEPTGRPETAGEPSHQRGTPSPVEVEPITSPPPVDEEVAATPAAEPVDAGTDDGQPPTELVTATPIAESERTKPAERASGTLEEAKKPEPTPELGRVTVTLVPWGTLVIDGSDFGSQRRQMHRLTPGRHTLELRQNGEAVASKTVDVQPGKNRMVKLIAAP